MKKLILGLLLISIIMLMGCSSETTPCKKEVQIGSCAIKQFDESKEFCKSIDERFSCVHSGGNQICHPAHIAIFEGKEVICNAGSACDLSTAPTVGCGLKWIDGGSEWVCIGGASEPDPNYRYGDYVQIPDAHCGVPFGSFY